VAGKFNFLPLSSILFYFGKRIGFLAVWWYIPVSKILGRLRQED
jgi:hypothetical protein